MQELKDHILSDEGFCLPEHPENSTPVQIENEVEGEREAFVEVKDDIKLTRRHEVTCALKQITKENWSTETDRSEGIVGGLSDKCYRTRRVNANIPCLPSIAMLEPFPKIQHESTKQPIPKVEFAHFEIKEKRTVSWEGTRIRLSNSSSIYGMGENCGGLLLNDMLKYNSSSHTMDYDRKREKIVDLEHPSFPRPRNLSICWNTDACFYDESFESLYQSHPWVLIVHQDGSATGVFVDSTYRTVIHLREEEGESDQMGVYFLSEADKGPPCVYLFPCSSPVEVIQELCHFTGNMELPPKWALGYQQCRYSYFPDTEVEKIAKGFRERNIPCDVIWIDIHYMDKYKCFTFDPERFPNPKQLNDTLHECLYPFPF